MRSNSGSMVVILGILIVGVFGFFFVSNGAFDGLFAVTSNNNLKFSNPTNEKITDGDVITSANVEKNGSKLSFYVGMNKNTFTYSIDFDVVNNDSTDVVIDNFVLEGLTENISKYVDFVVESRDGTRVVKDMLESGSTKHYVLKLTGNTDNNDVYDKVMNFKLGIEATSK